MTIIYKGTGNIFDSKMQTLVNPVNSVGAMGKGLAEEFKHRYPAYYRAYRQACRRNVFQTEKCFVYQLDEERKIYSFLTKYHWRDKSRLGWIAAGLERLVCEHLEHYNIKELAIPALGCGEGGLYWQDVEMLLHEWLEKVPIPVEIYVPRTKKEL